MYDVDVSEKLSKKVEKFPKKDLKNIYEKIEKLAENPRPRWAEKLTKKASKLLFCEKTLVSVL